MAAQLQFGIDTSASLSAGPRAELEARVVAVLRHPPAELSELELEVLRMLGGHVGRTSAVRAAGIARELNLREAAGETARRIVTRAVAALRDAGLPVGASRGKFSGYFLILDAEDQAAARRPQRSQFTREIQRYRKLFGKAETARVFGQVMLKLDPEKQGPGSRGQGSGKEAA